MIYKQAILLSFLVSTAFAQDPNIKHIQFNLPPPSQKRNNEPSFKLKSQQNGPTKEELEKKQREYKLAAQVAAQKKAYEDEADRKYSRRMFELRNKRLAPLKGPLVRGVWKGPGLPPMPAPDPNWRPSRNSPK